jgi:hypothetical protein
MRIAPESAKNAFQGQNFEFFTPDAAKKHLPGAKPEYGYNLGSDVANSHDFVRYSSRLFPFSCMFKVYIIIRSKACTLVSERILL